MSRFSSIAEIQNQLELIAQLHRRTWKGFLNVMISGRSSAEVRFNGAYVPDIRKLAAKCDLSYDQIVDLLQSKLHEERVLAVLHLVHKYSSDPEGVYQCYIKNTKLMNSWDLVDLSVYKVLGRHLADKNLEPLVELSKSELWWERRMAIVATYEWIRSGDFDFTLRLSRKYLDDENRYVLMATGWMLREVGKQNPQALRDFLLAAESVPVIVARYATEKMPELQQQIARRK